MNTSQPGYNYASLQPKMEHSPHPSHSKYAAQGTVLPPVRSRFHPRGWRTRTRVIVAIVAVIVIIAIIVGAYEGVKLNRYPVYSKLNYSLKDTFQGTNFFDNFNYFSGADPAEGFVM
jgi:hypothetical protein